MTTQTVTPQTINDSISSKIDELQTYIETVAGQLANYASLPYLSWVDFPPATTYTPDKTSQITAGQLPTLAKANPDPITTSLNPYLSKVWTSPTLQTLQNLMMTYIETGGTGITEAVEQAIYDRGRERDLQTTRDALDMAGSRGFSRGARRPNSAIWILQNQILTNLDDKKTDTSREIIRLMTTMAQQNTQFAAQAGISIEQAYMSFSQGFAGLIMNMNQDILAKFRVEQEARVEEFRASLETIKVSLETANKNAELDMKYQDQLLNIWQIQANLAYNKVLAQIGQSEQANTVKITALQAVATTIEGLLNSLSSTGISMVSTTTTS